VIVGSFRAVYNLASHDIQVPTNLRSAAALKHDGMRNFDRPHSLSPPNSQLGTPPMAPYTEKIHQCISREWFTPPDAPKHPYAEQEEVSLQRRLGATVTLTFIAEDGRGA
jgi:hypothetical protein